MIMYVKDDIPSRKLTFFKINEDIERKFIEINLRKSKCLILATHKQQDYFNDEYFDFMRNSFDFHS